MKGIDVDGFIERNGFKAEYLLGQLAKERGDRTGYFYSLMNYNFGLEMSEYLIRKTGRYFQVHTPIEEEFNWRRKKSKNMSLVALKSIISNPYSEICVDIESEPKVGDAVIMHPLGSNTHRRYRSSPDFNFSLMGEIGIIIGEDGEEKYFEKYQILIPKDPYFVECEKDNVIKLRPNQLPGSNIHLGEKVIIKSGDVIFNDEQGLTDISPLPAKVKGSKITSIEDPGKFILEEPQSKRYKLDGLVVGKKYMVIGIDENMVALMEDCDYALAPLANIRKAPLKPFDKRTPDQFIADVKTALMDFLKERGVYRKRSLMRQFYSISERTDQQEKMQKLLDKIEVPLSDFFTLEARLEDVERL